ncbi:nucleotide-binding alpha-beta plait domain-containing protein [Artemisia annua]|uniref:Nucleotide-binding alpha-beta plait domain-containing protein n=1 Tax=Artemisia annua TaxID=35608 RepID=A0A2U1MHH0_ARTAN|nr:nucleotide-binding alpha-beta plait domain-containing protein [Artemisia annua]
MKVDGQGVPKSKIPTSDFPPINPGPRPKSKFTPIGRSFREAVIGHKKNGLSPTVKSISLEEDGYLRSKLESCWVGKAKNFHVLQNAWDVIKNNGLTECKVKYVGGLSFLFEWDSKETAIKSLEENKIWVQQWFDDLKMWEDNGESYGRLTWIHIEGIPTLARSVNSVKSVVKDFGKILEVGRLDFDSKLILPIKVLMLVANSTEVCQTLNVELNGNVFSVRIFEERFQASSLISPPPYDQKDDKESDSEIGSVFEEEFIGPSMVVENVGIPSNEHQPLNTEDLLSTPVHCQSSSPGVSHSVNNGTINSFVEETEDVSLTLGQGCADDCMGPSIGIKSAHTPNGPLPSMAFDQDQLSCPTALVEPIENAIFNGARINERSIGSVPDLNIPIAQEGEIVIQEGENVIQDDPELDELLSSFQRLSQKANDFPDKGEKKRKSKPSKKNLVVGGASCPPPLVSQSDDAGFVGLADEECAMKIIGENIGFSFRKGIVITSPKKSRKENLFDGKTDPNVDPSLPVPSLAKEKPTKKKRKGVEVMKRRHWVNDKP